MALDGITITALACELSETLTSCKIEKISQPTKDEFVFHVRKKGFSEKLLINLSSNSPRVHFLDENRENPKTPPMFCMLLRKHIAGGTILSVKTNDFERLIELEISAYDELGYKSTKHVYIELLGKFANLILTSLDGRIIDCAKRVDFESSTRAVLPNIYYEYPPKQDKTSILDISDNFYSEIKTKNDLLNKIKGISPIVADEIFNSDGKILKNNLNLLKNIVKNKNYSAFLVYQGEIPSDFTFLELKNKRSKKQASFSKMLCDFYEQKEQTNALKSLHKELSRTVKNLLNRQIKKLEIQNTELLATNKREIYKNYGDLIVANLYNLPSEKADKIELINYFDQQMPKVIIPLDIKLSIKQNSDKYYLKYTKLKNAEEILKKEIIRGKNEKIYLESVLESINRTENSTDLGEIKAELVESRYIKASSKTVKKQQVSQPTKYISKDGFTIYSGKNNVQNDILTLKTASKSDLWFHTQKIHGTHVILITQGKDVPESTILECAEIAVYNSKAKNSSNVPVDFCSVFKVKKPRGAKPGMVVYDNYNTVYVTPNREKIEEMRTN